MLYIKKAMDFTPLSVCLNTIFFRRSLIISLLTLKADLILVWKKVHAMQWELIYQKDLFVGNVNFFHFFISSKYDFHVDAERVIAKS